MVPPAQSVYRLMRLNNERNREELLTLQVTTFVPEIDQILTVEILKVKQVL